MIRLYYKHTLRAGRVSLCPTQLGHTNYYFTSLWNRYKVIYGQTSYPSQHTSNRSSLHPDDLMRFFEPSYTLMFHPTDCNRTCVNGSLNDACDACVCTHHTLTGRVLATEGRPLSKANISLAETPHIVISQSNVSGHFQVSGVCATSQQFLVTRDKFVPTEVYSKILSKTQSSLEVKLENAGNCNLSFPLLNPFLFGLSAWRIQPSSSLTAVYLLFCIRQDQSKSKSLFILVFTILLFRLHPNAD